MIWPRALFAAVCLAIFVACLLWAFARCTVVMDEQQRVSCANLGTAVGRRTKYDIHVSGGTCFVECPNGWVFSDRYNGCKP